MKTSHRFVAAVLLCSAASAWASPDEDLVRPIQSRWAEIKYQNPEKKQADQYHALAVDAHKITEANPNSAAAMIWEGIVLSSEAGARGGLGALSLAKDARRLLEESLKLNERALDGSAYTSLATLYAKVPGWPIGFGDDEHAESLFRKSLEINPDGIDANFFYGEYLIDQDRVGEAGPYLQKALLAPARPGRELADEGRRKEVEAMLKTIPTNTK